MKLEFSIVPIDIDILSLLKVIFNKKRGKHPMYRVELEQLDVNNAEIINIKEVVETLNTSEAVFYKLYDSEYEMVAVSAICEKDGKLIKLVVYEIPSKI